MQASRDWKQFLVVRSDCAVGAIMLHYRMYKLTTWMLRLYSSFMIGIHNNENNPSFYLILQYFILFSFQWLKEESDTMLMHSIIDNHVFE